MSPPGTILVGGGLAALGGLRAAGSAIAAGLTVWLAAGLGIVVAALLTLAWRWQTRRDPGFAPAR